MVADFGSNRKRIYDFILVVIVTLVLSCTISEITTENCKFFLPLSHSALPLTFPSEVRGEVYREATRVIWGYPAVVTVLKHFDTIPACDGRTVRQIDGRTADERTDGRIHYS